MSGTDGRKPRGRRPGTSGARAAILAAARQRFAELGYDGANIREIAAEASVDPALVHHYFGTKESLFAAAMRLPNLPEHIFTGVLQGETDASRLGERLVRTVLTVWEDPDLPRMATGLLRSALTNERAAAMLREFVMHAILGRLRDALSVPDAEYRVSLVATQVVGFLMARYVLKLDPIAKADPEMVVRAIGPTLQRYLTGDFETAR